ncbi:MAG: uracil-DNA glycosylase [Bdellovibrionales bacterium]|nr:uracil-DNA glycosylase [Bdellovibrionales bacterium]
MSLVNMEPQWKQHLEHEFSKDYMKSLKSFLSEEVKTNKVYPKGSEYFQAFNLTPFEKVKVVILGQDPYHGPNQAHGLCFSVKPGVKVPPSLVNIYKELKSDVNFEIPPHGFLKHWADQGVLLLNATLSVRAGAAGSHQKKGWEEFTDQAIHALDQQRQGIVFMLWGSYAQKKGGFIDTKKHLVLKAPHPSPLSAHRGFLGCKHFSKCNEYLKKHGIEPIHWQLPLSVEY